MKIVRGYHFWLVVLGFAIATFLHYIEVMGLPDTALPSFHFGLTRHSLDRLLFLLPITYTAFIFGLTAGLATNMIALGIMLPRVIWLSPAPVDALLETALVVVQGTLVSLWFGTRTTEKENIRTTLAELEKAHQLLQGYVRSARSSEKRLTTLNAISTMLTQSIELAEVLRKAVCMVTELMEVEVALIFSLDEKTKEVRLIAYEGVTDEFVGAVNKIKLGETCNGEVIKTGHPMVVKDTSEDAMMSSPEVRRMKLRNEVIVPLISKNHITGTLCVAMRRPRDFYLEEVELLTAIGRQIGTAVENARLYESEREAAYRAAVSEKNYRQLFENANDAIWIHDMEGNITTANKAAAKLTGYTREELVKMNASNFLSQESLHLAREVRYKTQHGEYISQPYEQRLIKKDESEAVLMLATSLVTEDGSPSGFLHIARDMTQERRLQENLRYYLGQITIAQEEERKRIAHELHDETIQLFFSLSRQVDNYIRNNSGLSPNDVIFLQELRQQLNNAMNGIRRFSHDLRPPMLDDLGLMATLRWLVGNIKEQSGIPVEITVTGTERRLTKETEMALYRIVQEALRNVEKHAQASRVKVEITFGEGRIIISVSDNGKGFDLSGGVAELLHRGKLGLAGIEERVRLLDGKLKVQSEPDRGTSIEVEAPG